MIGEGYIHRKYVKFIKYWPDFDWPSFEDLDFAFRSSRDEWGSVEFLEHGAVRLSLDSACQRDSGMARSTLAHEVNHIFLGPKVGHGKRFNAAMLAALNRGLIVENLI